MKTRLRKGDLVTWSQLRRGDAFSYTRDGDISIVDWDTFPGDVGGNRVTYRGHARTLSIPGLSYPAGVIGKQLIVGCQRMNAEQAFRELARVLGYEVTP